MHRFMTVEGVSRSFSTRIVYLICLTRRAKSHRDADVFQDLDMQRSIIPSVMHVLKPRLSHLAD